MQITRRSFLAGAAGVMTMGLPLELWRPKRSSSWVLLDLQEDCCLSESASGYESALASLGPRFLRADPQSVSGCAALIVPAALELRPPAVRAIVTCLEAGARVILESGAGFAAGPQFRAHRVALRDFLQIRVEAPVQLWADQSSLRGIPYVDYTWPHPTKLRDFSRVVPLSRQAGEIIAWVGGLPVALKRRIGRGTLIFLGSPLGPALWAGDVEARRWLLEVVRA